MSKKDFKEDLIKENRTLIKLNSNKALGLIVYLDKFPDLISKVNLLSETIKYLNPSSNEQVTVLDKQIGKNLDDCRQLFASGKFNGEDITNALKKIEITISQRKTYDL